MKFSFRNRKNVEYFVKESVLKSGKVKFSVSKNSNDGLERLPEGYEFFENISGQVFIRKIKVCKIDKHEVSIVRGEIKKNKKAKYAVVFVDGDEITVYEPFENIDAMAECAFRGDRRKSLDEYKQYYSSNARYMPFFKFILIDENKRLFQAERFCFRGSVDSWISLNIPKTIEILAKEYCPHFLQDSFYDLV